VVQSLAFWLLLSLGAVAYWALPERRRPALLAVLSLAFLGLHDLVSFGVLLGETAVIYAISFHLRADDRPRRPLVALGIVTALAPLLAFKYIPPLLGSSLLIPLGISYYTFKLIHYVVDVARGSLRPHGLFDFVSYLWLFTTVTAGPIERLDHYDTHRSSTWTRDHFVVGANRIASGLIKKFVIADLVLLPILDDFGAESSLETHRLWIGVSLRYLYLYLDFSAYSDIAIGASRIFGLKIMENFNWPVVATDLSDFWRRWHMTLAGWVQRYVYMPLLGATRKPRFALVIAFAVIGVWHAGTLARLAWGLYHAAALIIAAAWTKRMRRYGGGRSKVRRAAGWVLTQGFVASSMVFFMFGEDGSIAKIAETWLRLFFIHL
jgi:alginate O-acetyltransferase complex protein AlgI